jgi:hypothetical protein
MSQKTKKLLLVALAGVLLVVSILYPNGPTFKKVDDKPVPAVVVGPVDDTIVGLLADATGADKQRIDGLYSALAVIVGRDKGKYVVTTEQWAALQGRTLELAIDQPGKYPGLDVAIENVFATAVGTDDVLSNSPETQQKLIAACEKIANSARK